MSTFSFSSKCRYYAKNSAQKVVGTLPGGYMIQEGVKSLIGHRATGGELDPENLMTRLRAMVESFNRNEIRVPEIVVEQGTGWTGTDLVLFFLCGSKKIHTFDTTYWLREDMFKQTFSIIAENLDELVKWQGVDAVEMRRRADLKKSLSTMSLDDLLREMGVDYGVVRDFDYSDIEPGTVDFFYSHSVLQRASINDVNQVAQRSFELLRKGGQGYHRVHPRDHNFINDRNVPPFYFLGISDLKWNLITSKYVNHQNRLRGVEFVDIFAKHGFDVSTDNVVSRDVDIEYAKEHLSSRYAGMDPSDIANFQTDLIVVKS